MLFGLCDAYNWVRWVNWNAIIDGSAIAPYNFLLLDQSIEMFDNIILQ